MSVPTNINQIPEAQKLAELELQEQVAGAASQPSYLISDLPPIQIDETQGSDQIKISSSIPLASPEVNSALSSQDASSTKNVEEREEQYLENSSEYQNAIEGEESNFVTQTFALTFEDPSGEAMGSSRSSGSSSGVGGGLDQVSSMEGELDKRVLEFTDEDHMVYNEETGYWEPDPEKLEEWSRFILARANVLMSLLIALSSQFEARRIADETFSGIPLEPEGKYSYKQSFARKIRVLQKAVQLAIINVFKKINTKNAEIYKQKMEEIKQKSSGTWFKVRNFWNAGHSSKELTKKSLRETQRYLETTKKTLTAMQNVITSLAAFLKATAGDGEGAIFNLTMAGFLTSFKQKLEEVNKDVDKKLEGVKDKLRELTEGDGPWYKKMWNGVKNTFKSLVKLDWKGFWGGIKTFLRGIQDGLDKIYIGYVLNFVLEPIQWLLTLTQDPVGTLLQLGELIMDGLSWLFQQMGLEVDLNKYTIDKVRDILEWVKEKYDKLGWWKAAGWCLLPFPVLLSLLPDKDWANIPEYQIVDMEEIIDEYRGGVVGIQNAYRMYLSLKMMPADLRNIAREKFTGLTGISNDAELLMVSAEMSLSHALQVFDASASQLMLKAKLHNQTIQLIKNLQQIEKAQTLGTLGLAAAITAVVLSIVATIATLGAGAAPAWVTTAYIISAVAGVTGAISTAGSQVILSRIEEYEPIAPHYDPMQSSGGSGSVVLDTLDRMEREEEANMRAAARNQGVIIQTKDELYTFNAQAFAAYELKQNILNNAIRAIFSLLKNGRDLRRVAEAELTGSAVQDSGAALLQNAVENILLQKQMILSAIKFQYQEVITAKNIAKQNELRAGKAGKGGFWSVVGAVVGALISQIPGLNVAWQVGMAIGSALASSAWQFYDAGWGEGNARDMTLEVDSRDLEKLLSKLGDESAEGKLDRAEAEAYFELMNSGIVGTGDGYYGVNFGLVTQTYSRIGAIYAAKELLAKVRAMSSELRDIVKQQFSGISVGTVGDLSLRTIQANFRTAMRVVNNIVSFLRAKVEVMNRARDAEKQFTFAKWTFGINVVLSAFGFGGTAAATETVDGVVNVTKPTLYSFARSTPSLMGLNNAAFSLGTNIQASNTNKGYYEGYDAKTTVDRTGRKVKNPRTIDEKLDALEYEILCEMNESLLQTLDGSYLTVSPLSAKLSTRMQNLYNIKEALAIARSLLTDAKRAAGAKVFSSDFGRDSIETQKAVALALLDSLKGALETIVQRQNQIEEAKKGILLSAIKVGLSLAAITCSIVAIAKSVNVEDKETIYSDTNKTSKTGTAAVPALSGESQANTALETIESESTDPIAKASTGKNLKKNIADRIEARKSARNWEIAASLLSLTSIFADYIVDVGYDKAVDKKEAKLSKKSANLDLNKTGSKKGAQSSEGKGDYFSSLDSMDADIATAEFNQAVSETNSAAAVYVAARNEKLMPFILSAAKEITGFIKQVLAPIEVSYPDLSKIEAKAIPAEREARGNILESTRLDVNEPVKPADEAKVATDGSLAPPPPAETEPGETFSTATTEQDIENIGRVFENKSPQLCAEIILKEYPGKPQLEKFLPRLAKLEDKVKALKILEIVKQEHPDLDISSLVAALPAQIPAQVTPKPEEVSNHLEKVKNISQLQDPKAAKEIRDQMDLLKAAAKALKHEVAEAKVATEEYPGKPQLEKFLPQLAKLEDNIPRIVKQKRSDLDHLISSLVAALSGQIPAQVTPKPSESFKAKETRTPSTRALLDYADKIENDILVKGEEFSREVVEAQAEIGKTEADIAALEQELAKPEVPDKEAIEARISQLKVMLAEKQAKLKKLITQFQSLQDQIKKVESETPRKIEAAQQEVNKMRSEMERVSGRIAELQAKEGTLKPEEKVELNELRAILKELQTEVEISQHAQKLLKHKVNELKQQVDQLKQQIMQGKREIAAINKQIGLLQMKFAKLEREENQQTDKKVAHKGKSSSKPSSGTALAEAVSPAGDDNQGGNGKGNGNGNGNQRWKQMFAWLVGKPEEKLAESTNEKSQLAVTQGRQGKQNPYEQYLAALAEENAAKSELLENSRVSVAA